MYYTTIGKSMLLYQSHAHFHDEWEIVLNLEGEGTARIDGRSFSITAGTVICIPPKTLHAKESPKGFRDIYIHFPLLSLPTTPNRLVFEDEDRRIEQLMLLIHGIYHKRDYGYREITDHLACALEQVLIGKFNARHTDVRVSRIADLAVEHFTDPDFSISDVIQKSGYCEDHMRRLFRRELGVSPLEYLTALRVNHAKKLMRENQCLHYTVALIGSMAGFSDISYFSRVFKKSTGISPREYLRLVKENDVPPPIE